MNSISMRDISILSLRSDMKSDMVITDGVSAASAPPAVSTSLKYFDRNTALRLLGTTKQ